MLENFRDKDGHYCMRLRWWDEGGFDLGWGLGLDDQDEGLTI